MSTLRRSGSSSTHEETVRALEELGKLKKRPLAPRSQSPQKPKQPKTPREEQLNGYTPFSSIGEQPKSGSGSTKLSEEARKQMTTDLQELGKLKIVYSPKTARYTVS